MASQTDTRTTTTTAPATGWWTSERSRKWVKEARSLSFALLAVLLIRSSLLGVYQIPSGSMIPTLVVGDRLFVNKLAYAVKIPFSDWIAEKPKYLMERGIPERGDIIVFRYPRDESIDFIKRVIGVPGDRISVRGKQIVRNGEPVAQEPTESQSLIDTIEGGDYDRTTLELRTESGGSGSTAHLVLVDRAAPTQLESFHEVTVPEGHLFVMGDNRDFSNDSRFWGFVPIENVQGKAEIIYFSSWIDFAKGQYFFHPERILRRVD